MPQLHVFTAADIDTFLSKREGETKMGETIQTAAHADPQQALAESDALFVILGLPEDIGVRGNGGVGGAHTAWGNFLRAFLNTQRTPAWRGEDFLLWGEVDFRELMAHSDGANAMQLRSMADHIDSKVFPLIKAIVAADKIPVVIGGGHNNAYPILKGASMASGKALHAINLDAHSDFRVKEGRHSGNGFRYAYEEHFLKRYAMLGLHEAYNSAPVIADLKTYPDLLPLFWEDIFMRGKMSWRDAVNTALAFVSGDAFGVELDVDCIEQVLSSAATPVGVHSHHAMQYLYQCGASPNATYLHLPEGVSERSDGQRSIFTGKLLSYLVQAFAKGVLERNA